MGLLNTAVNVLTLGTVNLDSNKSTSSSFGAGSLLSVLNPVTTTTLNSVGSGLGLGKGSFVSTGKPTNSSTMNPLNMITDVISGGTSSATNVVKEVTNTVTQSAGDIV